MYFFRSECIHSKNKACMSKQKYYFPQVPRIQPQADAFSQVIVSPGTPQIAGAVEADFRERDGTPHALSETEAHVPKPRHQTFWGLQRISTAGVTSHGGGRGGSVLPSWCSKPTAAIRERTSSGRKDLSTLSCLIGSIASQSPCTTEGALSPGQWVRPPQG